eukprot:1931948-Pyramimonas_sp.AAC.1
MIDIMRFSPSSPIRSRSRNPTSQPHQRLHVSGTRLPLTERNHGSGMLMRRLALPNRVGAWCHRWT